MPKQTNMEHSALKELNQEITLLMLSISIDLMAFYVEARFDSNNAVSKGWN